MANLYYPPSERGLQLTMSRAAVALVGGSVGGLMSEFWEDIHNKISKKRHSRIADVPAVEPQRPGAENPDHDAVRSAR